MPVYKRKIHLVGSGLPVQSFHAGLTMQLTLDIVVAVFVATIAMCIVSGLLALRQLVSADPASLF